MVLTPRKSAARASSSNRISLGMKTLQDSEDVVLFHDQELFAVELDLVPGVLAEEDAIAGLDREGQVRAVVGHAAGAHGDHLALLGLFLGGVGNDETAVLGVLFLETLDEHAVVQRTERR